MAYRGGAYGGGYYPPQQAAYGRGYGAYPPPPVRSAYRPPVGQGVPPPQAAPAAQPVAQPPPPAAAAPTAPTNPFLEPGLKGKLPFNRSSRPLAELQRRSAKRIFSSDLISTDQLHLESGVETLPFPLDVEIPVDVESSDKIDVFSGKASGDEARDRHFVRALLFTGVKKPKEEVKGKPLPHLLQSINFLVSQPVGKGEKDVVAAGAEWDPSVDGATPSKEALVKAAVRAVKGTFGIDISSCDRWIEVVRLHYKRENGEAHTATYLLPNVWEKFPEGLKPLAQWETKVVEEKKEAEEAKAEEGKEEAKEAVPATTTEVVAKPFIASFAQLLELGTTANQPEGSLELGVAAEALDEFIQTKFAEKVLSFISEKKAKVLEEKKRERDESGETEESAKKAKISEVDGVRRTVKTEHHVDQQVLLPFQYFDRGLGGGVQGYLKRDVLEGILYQVSPFSRNEVDALLDAIDLKRPAAGKAQPVLYYIKLATVTTETIIEEVIEKEAPAEAAPAEGEGEAAAEGSIEVEGAAEEQAGEEAAEEGETEEQAEGDADADETNQEAGGDGIEFTEKGLNKVLLKDLKTMCTERGLSIIGKKAELIERLIQHGK